MLRINTEFKATHQTSATKRDPNGAHQVDSDGCTRHKDDEGNDLCQSMNPDGRSTGDETHEDGAKGEEDNNGQRG